MNENPGETPNPLNPNPGVGSETNNPSNPSGSMGASGVANETPATEAQQVDPLMQATAGITDQGTDPLSRPMEQAPAAAPVAEPKKKKTGLIIGIVVAVVLLIGGGIAAALLLRNQGDPVAKAVAKIMAGETPTNISVGGTIEFQPSDTASGITNVKVDLSSEATSNSFINFTNANVTVSMRDLGDITLQFSEIYAESGNFYFKIDGAKKALEDITTMMNNTSLNDTDMTNCVDDESGLTNCGDEALTVDCLDEEDCISPTTSITGELAPYMSIAESLDGVWLKVSSELISQLTNTLDDENSVKCLTDFVNDARNNRNSIAEIYNRNPFVISTTEGVTVASKNSTVYKVTFDQEKMKGFSDSIQNSDWVKKASSCLGGNSTDDTDVAEKISEMPTFYAEIDKDNNFSRIYFSDEIAADETCYCPEDEDVVCAPCPEEKEAIGTMTLDLNFTYPSTINVAEPIEYQDLTTLLQQLFTSNSNIIPDQS